MNIRKILNFNNVTGNGAKKSSAGNCRNAISADTTLVTLFGVMILICVSGTAFAADRLELDDTAIIGSRELPKVLYIVPWKESRIGTLAGVSEKGSFKEGMTALDRDVFLREIKYYGVISSPDAVMKK